MACESCRWWSETCAKWEGDGPLLALCENEASPKFMTYTQGGARCRQYENARTFRPSPAPDARSGSEGR